MKRWAWLLWLVGFAACASRCDFCGAPDDLAELTTLSGSEIDRDRAPDEGAWQGAMLGDRFRVGDGLRTGQNSTAELALLPSGLAHVEPRTVLRFLANAPASPNRQLAVETGAVEIVARELDLEIHTPRAIAKVTRGSRLKLSTTPDGQERFDLVVGRVVVAHEGVEKPLAQNQPLELKSAETPTNALAAEEPAVAAEPPAGPEPSSAPVAVADAALNGTAVSAAAVTAPSSSAPTAPEDASRPSDDAATKRHDLTLSQLESSTIHVAQPPVALLIPVPDCAAQSKISVDGAAIASDASGAVALLAAGAHKVRVLCGNRLVREAQLRVKRDAAKMDLPKRAQEVRVEADGRRYTVRYQNLLPVVTFAWPVAQAGGPFTLTINKAARETSYTLQRPEHALAGGALGEGEYRFWFRDGSGRNSQSSTLRLSFDNTARSAYLSAPADGSAATSEGVEVEGAALLRSQVRVQGKPVPLDDKGRFHTHAQSFSDENTISVRVEHPESGVHYYVRRLR